MGIAESVRTVDAWMRRAEDRPLPWLAAFALILALQISALWYPTPDATAYLSIARRLAAGGPVTRLGDPQLGFPLGYPLLLSPLFRFGERPFLALSMLHWLLAVVFMAGAYRWARNRIGPPALWVAGLVMTNVNVWILYRRTLSEAAFLALMIWTVLALNALLDGGRLRVREGAPAARANRMSGLGTAVAAAALLIALSAIREAGLLFAAGFAVALLLRVARGRVSRRAAALPLAVTAAALLAAAAALRPERIAAAGPAFAGRLAGYADVGSAVGASLAARLHLRMTEIGRLLVPGMFSAYGDGWIDINTFMYLPLLALVAFGWWRLVRRGADVFGCTAPLYFGFHLAWPYAAGTRYMLPLLPLLLAALWLAYAPLHIWRRSLFAALLIAHLGVALGFWLIIDRPDARECNRQWPAVERLAGRIGLDSGAAVAADVPTCVTLMLDLALDRPVRPADGIQPADPHTQWIVTRAGAPAVASFRIDTGVGDYTLLRRVE